jgi:acyl dehydratase
MATVELKSAPGSAGLYFKAALGMTPLAGGRKKELPNTVFSLAPKKVDTGQLQAFCRVTEHTNIGSLPPIYFNMLAFPLHMALLTSDGFPFPVIGLVHVQNKIDQVRPVDVGEELGLQVRAENLRPHAKGRQFDVISEARVGDELVSTATSTYLRLGGGGDKTESTGSGESIDYAALPQIAEWKLPGDLGRRYASVSGDRNPIHMHNLSAKAFGFPKAIAHGMWTKARALAAIDNKLPDAFSVDVAFKRPILLPSKVVFGAAESDAGLDFTVRNAKKGTPHLDGSVRS